MLFIDFLVPARCTPRTLHLTIVQTEALIKISRVMVAVIGSLPEDHVLQLWPTVDNHIHIGDIHLDSSCYKSDEETEHQAPIREFSPLEGVTLICQAQHSCHRNHHSKWLELALRWLDLNAILFVTGPLLPSNPASASSTRDARSTVLLHSPRTVCIPQRSQLRLAPDQGSPGL